MHVMAHVIDCFTSEQKGKNYRVFFLSLSGIDMLRTCKLNNVECIGVEFLL